MKLGDKIAAMIGSTLAYMTCGALIIWSFNIWAKIMWQYGWLDISWLKEALK